MTPDDVRAYASLLITKIIAVTVVLTMLLVMVRLSATFAISCYKDVRELWARTAKEIHGLKEKEQSVPLDHRLDPDALDRQ